MTITLTNSLMAGAASGGPLRAVLQRLGPEAGGNAHLSGLMQVLLAFDPADPADAFLGRIEQLADDQTGTPRWPPASGSATCGRTPATRPARSRPPSATLALSP